MFGSVLILRMYSGMQRPPAGGSVRDGDNSNSQFAVLALWAAQSLAGTKVPKKTWKRVRSFYEGTQQDNGSWNYTKVPGRFAGGRRRSPNMTAAGLVSFVYASAALAGGAKGLEKARASKPAQDGLRYFMNKRSWRYDDYYFVYSLERVGTVLDAGWTRLSSLFAVHRERRKRRLSLEFRG